MKHRFLLHSLSHTVLVVDITEVGLPIGAQPDRREQTVPILRFRGWGDAELYFRALGASREALGEAAIWLRKAGIAVLTIT